MKLNASPKMLVVIFVLMFAVVFASSKLLTGVRVDLTENGLYTLSEGTRNILSKLEQPVTLKLYFSDKGTRQLPALRTYAQRVEELIEEYVSLSKGKLSFEKVDPEPFSEAEDEASLAGLQGVPAGISGDNIYFGLVAKGEGDKQEVIAFMKPDRERFLEYELTQLIANLSAPDRPKLGIWAGIDVRGGFDYMTRQPKPEWTVISMLQSNFDLEWINDDATEITGVDALVLIAPKDMQDGLKFAIDQYVIGGGKAMIFLDPFAEAANEGMPMPAVQRADLAELLPNWGLKLREDMFLTDYSYSMVVGVGQQRSPTRHIGLLGLTPDAMDTADIAMDGLESLNWSSVGILDRVEGSEAIIHPLITSSTQAQPREAELLLTLHDPRTLMKEFAPTGEQYLLAARVTGKAKTAYPDGMVLMQVSEDEAAETEEGAEKAEKPTETKQLTPKVTETDQLQLLVVADTDLLTDRLWVQVQQFFGQRIVQPWADNGSFVMNAVEHLSGNPDLISIRTQGRFNRPFVKVEQLRRDAEARFLEQEELLQEELSKTEEKLVELENARSEGDGALFTPEQEAELQAFQEEKLKIRKQLRDVQHQLDQDIEALGTQLKLINIFLVPGLICLLLFVGTLRKRVA